MLKPFYSPNDYIRELELPTTKGDNRPPFARDYSRLIHSPSFRRLTGKTQLYPGLESDFFRNRLTHSIEVADIAKSIAIKINEYLKENYGIRNENKLINLDLVNFACLAHDLGHPPFGHIGEKALDEKMQNYGRFEGNAQTLRLLSRIEKKDLSKEEFSYDFGYVEDKDFRLGLNVCYRSLASILKYSDKCLENKSHIDYKGVEKGFYNTESKLVEQIKTSILNGYQLEVNEEFKVIECYIMDIADDIAYTTYDFEDALKGNFISLLDLFDLRSFIWDDIIKDINSAIEKANRYIYVGRKLKKFIYTNSEEKEGCITDLLNHALAVIDISSLLPDTPKWIKEQFVDNPDVYEKDYQLYVSSITYNYIKNLSHNGYLRRTFSNKIVKTLIQNIDIEINEDKPCLSKVFLKRKYFLGMEVLKKFIYHSQIASSRLSIVEFRGREIIDRIFEVIFEENNYSLLPNDYHSVYFNHLKKASSEKKARHVCDFISGMTDRYAVEFYGRLTSENPETIFKPL